MVIASRPVRVLTVAPIALSLAFAILALAPVLLLLAALCSLFSERRRAVRVVWIALVYLARDLAATVASFGLWVASGFGRTLSSPSMQRAHYAVMGWFIAGLIDAAVSVGGLRLSLDSSSAAAAALAQHRRPMIVFSRHAGIGDSFLIVHELMNRYHRDLRVVMKGALQLDPVIDTFGHRLPNCFIASPGGDPSREICSLAHGLGNSAALLIFPEGGNFTRERRRRAIRHLWRRGRVKEAAAAQSMENVVSPQPGGALAALAGAPGADVVFMAHTGLPTSAGMRQTWKQIPLQRPVEMRMWHVAAEEIPETEDEQVDWLLDWWSLVDTWIQRHDAGIAGVAPFSGDTS